MQSWNRIPAELQDLPRWVVSVINEDGRKMPVSAITGGPASVTDPSTWATFDQACSDAELRGAAIGFVLTADDSYSIIDLDNKESKPATPEELALFDAIIQAFATYTEVSHSGRGVHIVARGKLPPGGRRRGNIEIYDRDRYMIFTGNVLHDLPIEARPDELAHMVGQMGGSEPAWTSKYVYTQPAQDEFSDQEVYERISSAANADKFWALWNGRLADLAAHGMPEDYSVARHSLIEFLRLYTNNNADQSYRIYCQAPLLQRPDAPDATKTRNHMRRSHFDYSWRKNWTRHAEEQAALDLVRQTFKVSAPNNADLDQWAASPEEQKAAEDFFAGPQQPVYIAELPSEPDAAMPRIAEGEIPLPPGLVGEIAQYIYGSSIRPVREAALMASVAFMGGLCGRAYNVNGTGLNQYLIFVAKSGRGKEGMRSGMGRIVNAMRQQNGMMPPDAIIGPTEFASGQALHRYVSKNPCFVTVWGEFGMRLRLMNDPKSVSGPNHTLKKAMLDIYGKSGWGSQIDGAAYSDTEKNIAVAQSPCPTILGETTPSELYDGLSASHVASGLLPRFLVLEYDGPRVPENPAANAMPDLGLVHKCLWVYDASARISGGGQVVNVPWDTEGGALLKAYNDECDRRINASEDDAIGEIFNRAHLKALKLAGLVAVGVNPAQPCIDAACAAWAIDFVRRDVQKLMARFESGDVGEGDQKQYHDLMQVVKRYFTLPKAQLDRNKIPLQMQLDGVIPQRWLQQQTAARAAFRNDRLGSTVALKRNIQLFLENNVFVPVPKTKAAESYRYAGSLFYVNRADL